MRSRTALGLIGIVLLMRVFDPSAWIHWEEYGHGEVAAWDVFLTVIHIAVLITLGYLVMRGRTRLAAYLALAECGAAIVLGVTVTHVDLLRGAITDFEGRGVALLLYAASLALHCLLAGYLYFQHAMTTVGLPLTPDDDGRFAA